MKRAQSPAGLPLAKRRRQGSRPLSPPLRSPPQTFPNIEEVVFQIFSYLDAVDLCSIQSVSTFWCRLAADNQLWKALFTTKHPLNRLRGGRSSYARSRSDGTDGRDMKPPLRRASALHAHRQDWKWMYRIAWNWERGRCSRTHLCPSKDSLSRTVARSAVLAGPVTVASADSVIILHSPDHPDVRQIHPSCTTSHITALALDQSSPSSTDIIRLAAFHHSGYFAVHGISSVSFESHELYTYSTEATDNSQLTPRTSDIACASYHHPILITLSSAFYLSVYHLPDRGESASSAPIRPRLHQILHSFSSFLPSSLSLVRPSPTLFKLVIANAVPVFPAHWSAAVSEIAITLEERGVPGADSDVSIGIATTRHATAVGNGWLPTQVPLSSPPGPGSSDDEAPDLHYIVMQSRAMEQWGRKVGSIVGIQTDGKWVVLAGDDNTLQVYRLHRPPAPSQIALSFVQTLHGHTAGISTLKVADGRCVSVGREGGMWIWDLEAGWAVPVGFPPEDPSDFHQPEKDKTEESGSTPSTIAGPRIRTMVAFDERRIVSSSRNGGYFIWRFDL